MEGGPDADEKIGLSTEEERENEKGERGEMGGRREEEDDLRGDERKPYTEEGSIFEAEGVEDVGEHEGDSEGGGNGGATQVEEEEGRG